MSALTAALLSWGPAHGQEVASEQSLSDLSIEQLGNIDVTSVSRRAEPLRKAAAAIYVITQDAIRRSGALSLPEALRLAPNLEVARLNAFSYTVTARGFNSPESANKLLVLIDGRSVYSPLGSTVFWESVNVPLEDIERIEVISGPGGTLWGANAVNGVINIITYDARQNPGGLVQLGGGSTDRTAFAQYSGTIGNTAYRVYGNGFDRSDTLAQSASDKTQDAWRGLQGGFRTDTNWQTDALTVEGDLYNAATVYDFMEKVFGGNLTAHWSETTDDGSTTQIMGYYAVDNRAQPGLRDLLTTYDVQGQHSQSWYDTKIVWGGEFRLWHEGIFTGGTPFFFARPNGTITLGSAFAQGDIPLAHALALTLGLRLEDNSLSGLDYLPDARIGWTVSPTAFLWAAVSRSVRTPSRIDQQLQAPGFLAPSPDFESETLLAYEAGYRGTILPNLSLNISSYFNRYDRMRTDELTMGGLPIVLGNGITGDTYGFDSWATYTPIDWERVDAGFNWLNRAFRLKQGHTDISQFQSIGMDPAYQWQIRSQTDLSDAISLDLTLRGVDHVTRIFGTGPLSLVPTYVELNARIGWHVTDNAELAIEGQNLLHNYHVEVNDVSTFPERAIQRSVFLSLRSTL